MKFTKNHENFLKEIGYKKEDLPQIKRAKRVLKLTDGHGKKITNEKAVEILGENDFLSGLARSAFHWTAYRENENGESVLFDASKLFE